MHRLLFRPAAARRITAAIALTLFLPSCTGWSTRPVTTEQFPAGPDGHSREVRITLRSGARIVARDPWIADDSLMWLGPAPQDSARRTLAVPLSQVVQTEVRHFNVVGTVLLVGLGVTLVAVAVSGSEQHGNPGDSTLSCPVLYSWDGTGWRLDSGTFGGAVLQSLARTDVDNLDFVHPEADTVRLRLADILPETDYVDAIALLAVDHDPDVTVAPDGAGELHTVGAPVAPVAARDDDGRDLLPRVRSADGWNWESTPRWRDTLDPRALRDGIELDFVRPAGTTAARLVLDGNNTPWAAAMVQRILAAHGREARAWYDSLDAAPARARALATRLAAEGFLTASLRGDSGWTVQGMFWEAGPEVSKRQVLPLDLSRVRGDTIHLRLESVPSFWLIDRVALDFTPERPVSTTVLGPVRAVTSAGQDVGLGLARPDHNYVRLIQGERVELLFRVPPLPEGSSRSYLARTTGWYRMDPPPNGPPDSALLNRLWSSRGGLGWVSVSAMNHALARLAAGR